MVCLLLRRFVFPAV